MNLSVFLVTLVALASASNDSTLMEIQSYDGSGNNLKRPWMGAVGEAFLRTTQPAYGPQQAPSGRDRANARDISNKLFGRRHILQNELGTSDFLAAWGYALHFDTNFAAKNTSDAFHIPVPAGDPDFDPFGANKSIIPMFRAAYAGIDEKDNYRIISNSFSSYIDGSGLYGNSATEAASMRLFKRGLLKSTKSATGEYPPRIVGGRKDGYFAFTNPSINSAPHSLTLYILLFREHNRRARLLHVANPDWTDEHIYQRSRRWVISLIQMVSVEYYVPALTGSPLPPYLGYKESVNPQIDLFFSQVASIYGHSTLNEVVYRIDDKGEQSKEGHMYLRDAMFRNLCEEVSHAGIDSLVRGFITQRNQVVDANANDDVRSNLQVNPGFNYDLIAIGIQRGRDVGMCDFNSCRKAFNLPTLSSWKDLTGDEDEQQMLAELYPDINDLDASVGSMAEKSKEPNSLVGLLTAASIREQFLRLRDGDRFWYQNAGVLTEEEANEMATMSLGRVITLNTGVEYFPDDPFVALNASLGYFAVGPASQVKKEKGLPSVSVLDKLRLSWNISLADQSITFVFESNTTGWFGFGFGTSMKGADIYFCNDDGTGTFSVQDSYSYFTQPISSDVSFGGKSNVKRTFDVTAQQNKSTRVVTFTRQLQTGDEFDTDIIDGDMDVIFACSSSTKLLWHGPSNRVHTIVNFFSAGVTPIASRSLSSLIILHSFFMFIAFAILCPLGIYIARYHRNLGKWLSLHTTIMNNVTSNVLVAALTAIIGSFGNSNSLHYKVGMAVIVLVFASFAFGYFAMRLYAKHHYYSRLAAVLRVFHRYSGFAAYLVGLAACYLGVGELSTATGTETYLELSFLIVTLIFPVTLFVYGERLKHMPLSSKDDMGLNKLPLFRWDDVNQRVSLGAKWIVIDDVIYDVQKYLIMHPGGPESIYQMIGIDAAFVFDPKKRQTLDRDQKYGLKLKKALELHKFDNEIEKLKHDHSRLAHNLLSAYAMGTLLKDEEQVDADVEEEKRRLLPKKRSDSLLELGMTRLTAIPVQVNVFKFYVIGNMELLTAPDSLHPVYKVRINFQDEEAEMLSKPGDSYLFQFADKTGKLVTRSYTPLDCVTKGGIDFMIKMYDGEMTSYIMRSKSVRMRGPIPRATLLNPYSDSGNWKVLGLIAGGTGVTAMILIIDYHLRNCKRDPVTNKPDFQIHLLFSNTTEASIFGRAEITELEVRACGALTVTYIAGQASDTFDGIVGPINAEVITATMPKISNPLWKKSVMSPYSTGFSEESWAASLASAARAKSSIWSDRYDGKPTLMNVKIGDLMRGMGYNNVLTI
ncbi:hypothetical protein HDU77_009702 [Chytriomyces hyalinus]|nr:hypothetical protein HDU77_009702 [Chytriomyces hyalinus]